MTATIDAHARLGRESAARFVGRCPHDKRRAQATQEAPDVSFRAQLQAWRKPATIPRAGLTRDGCRAVAAPAGVLQNSTAMPPSRALRIRAAFVFALFALLFALCAEAESPKRVLILHSFGRDFAPYDTIASVFRTDLAQRSADPITFIEANLDFGRAANGKEERAFVEYLSTRFGDAPPNAVVSIGPPAARFYLRHRAELFPDAPMVMGALDERFVQQVSLPSSDAVVAGKVDLPRLVENILQLLPDTETIAVVIGASELERFWFGELQRELAPFASRVKFEWLNELSLVQMQERVAKLPPHSAVFYGLLIVDAAGVPHERQDALASLRAASNAPIFGIYESELGKGVVGGPYTSQRRAGTSIASVTLRALSGPPDSGPQVDIAAFESPVYDWRELERWHIEQGRLPPGSEIRFRPPSIWQEHRIAVIATSGALVFQALLIAALLLQSARRLRAERAAEALAGRLVTAHEDERRRLARELHDDVTQRLAGLAIDAARIEGGAAGRADGAAAHSIREGLAELSEDVHALSYRLHPSVIEDLGLVEALKIECDRVAHRSSLRANFAYRDVPRNLSPEAALCLFRVAQEALRNVERHAGANDVEVFVEGNDGGVAISVRDNGAGFDPSRAGGRASLGLASMKERVRLLGGRLDIESGRGTGTVLHAWVPLRKAA
jgi:signal transduction histidine kinase